MADRISSTMGAGVTGGALATTAMSGVMLAAQRSGLMGKLPPAKIGRAMLRRLPLRRTRPREQTLSVLGHYGYGIACGAAYALIDRALARRIPPTLRGALFGIAVYAASYKGWLPALGVMPPPKLDRPGRQPSMVLAHVVFGAVLGAVVARWRSPSRVEWPAPE